MQENRVTVYFDGLCPLCSREINHYQKKPGAEKIRFVDITDGAFEAEAEGVDPVRVHRHLHAKNSEGELRTGVDAFITIWQALPTYHWAAQLAAFPPLKLVLRVGYAAFALVRPILPRKKMACATSPYCEWKEKK